MKLLSISLTQFLLDQLKVLTILLDIVVQFLWNQCSVNKFKTMLYFSSFGVVDELCSSLIRSKVVIFAKVLKIFHKFNRFLLLTRTFFPRDFIYVPN